MKTIDDLFKEALQVQNACNLCGVAQSFARAMRDLMELRESTSDVNMHPIVTLWIDKMASLNDYSDAKANVVMASAISIYEKE
jgi:hypothetical protein